MKENEFFQRARQAVSATARTVIGSALVNDYFVDGPRDQATKVILNPPSFTAWKEATNNYNTTPDATIITTSLGLASGALNISARMSMIDLLEIRQNLLVD